MEGSGMAGVSVGPPSIPGEEPVSAAVAPPGASALRRDNRGLLQFLEQPALQCLASHMPSWVRPDMLTGTGFAGAVVAAVGYAFAGDHPAMLWLASFGILLNWFGDSLDGSLARFQRIERPTYGFFLDNATDVLEYGLFAIGFGLSGYLPWPVVLATLAAFYMVLLLGLIKAQVTGVFQIAFAGIGLTEVRCAFILVNAALYFIPPQPLMIGRFSVTYPGLIALAWIAVQVATFLVVMVQTLRLLSVQDPPRSAAAPTGYAAVGEPRRPVASG
jgi:phosphatidylglycerophosphate synthase